MSTYDTREICAEIRVDRGDAEIASEKIKQKRGRDKQIGVGEREIRQIGQRIRAEEDWAEKRALCSAICL